MFTPFCSLRRCGGRLIYLPVFPCGTMSILYENIPVTTLPLQLRRNDAMGDEDEDEDDESTATVSSDQFRQFSNEWMTNRKEMDIIPGPGHRCDPNENIIPVADCTEPGIKACTWLQEITSCSCLTVLPGPAYLLLNKIYIPLFRALYSIKQIFRIGRFFLGAQNCHCSWLSL